MSFYQWLHHRASGRRPQIGSADSIMRKVYNAIQTKMEWNDLVFNDQATSEYGAIFNLEFSPAGNLLAAACEKKAILLFDAISQRQIHRIMDAHTDNVNCVKFLDKSTFATCSDDTTVAIWDIRCLKTRLRSLRGHSNWVKNIEYSNKDGLLVTSGFDGSIFTWDINSYTEEGLIYQKVFNTSGLMRCVISPDGTKLVMCTTGGYLMIIHDLDLTTLHKDLCGFRPNIFRLMQMGNQYIPQAAKFDHIFSKKQKRNRVELVSDFPSGDEAEVILALQMHPKGLSFLSRNISYDERTEWSCIHDINEESYDITHAKTPQRRKRKHEKESPNPSKNKVNSNRFDPERTTNCDETAPSTSTGLRPTAPLARRISSTDDTESTMFPNPSISWGVVAPTGVDFAIRPGYAIHANYARSNRYSRRAFLANTNLLPLRGINSPTNHNQSTSTTRNGSENPQQQHPEFVPDIWAAEITIQERAARQARGSQTNSVTGYDFVYAISSGILPTRIPNVQSVPGDPNTIDIIPNNGDKHIIQNANKLMFYIEESNKGKGFIKEPSFSSDGRIICSPYENGIRLLAYSENCSEHPQWSEAEKLKKSPRPLVQVKTILCHSDIVLSTAFSPTQPLLVSGCKFGKVTWYYPKL